MLLKLKKKPLYQNNIKTISQQYHTDFVTIGDIIADIVTIIIMMLQFCFDIVILK